MPEWKYTVTLGNQHIADNSEGLWNSTNCEIKEWLSIQDIRWGWYGGRHKPYYFVFEDKESAMRFKLRWG